MKFITEIINRLCYSMERFSMQRMDDMHLQVHKAFTNAVYKGVGYLQVDEKGRVTSISPNRIIITALPEEKK